MRKKKTRISKIPIEKPITSLSFEEIQCSTTKCEEDKHCFRTTERDAKKFGEHGVCIECGKKLVDWNRVHKRSINDVVHTFHELKHETIRHFYFHKTILEQDLEKAHREGMPVIERRINARIAQMGKENPFRAITPYSGDIIFYAQHATATCCRRCLQYWHGIDDLKRALTDEEKNYVKQLILLFIKEKLPGLFITAKSA